MLNLIGLKRIVNKKGDQFQLVWNSAMIYLFVARFFG